MTFSFQIYAEFMTLKNVQLPRIFFLGSNSPWGGAGGGGGHELIAVVVERGVGSLVPFILPPPQRNGELMAAFTSNFFLIDM